MPRLQHVLVALLLALAAAVAVPAQHPLEQLRNPSEPRVLLLGTFHFQDAGLDAYKPAFAFDIRSAQRQRELEEVITRLAAWRPTRIAVEAPISRQGRLDSLFALYPGSGTDTLRNEIYQVAFRLAKRLALPGVHAIDAPARSFDPDMTREEWARRDSAVARGPLSSTDWDARHMALYRWDDSLKSVRPLRETLLYANDPKRLRAGHGHYLVGRVLDGERGDYFGADGFLNNWFNRNIRIYSNVMRLIRSPDERVLVLIGAGHVPILKHLLETTPAAHLDDIREVLR
jgi:hypothetical protein